MNQNLKNKKGIRLQQLGTRATVLKFNFDHREPSYRVLNFAKLFDMSHMT